MESCHPTINVDALSTLDVSWVRHPECQFNKTIIRLWNSACPLTINLNSVVVIINLMSPAQSMVRQNKYVLLQ